MATVHVHIHAIPYCITNAWATKSVNTSAVVKVNTIRLFIAVSYLVLGTKEASTGGGGGGGCSSCLASLPASESISGTLLTPWLPQHDASVCQCKEEGPSREACARILTTCRGVGHVICHRYWSCDLPWCWSCDLSWCWSCDLSWCWSCDLSWCWSCDLSWCWSCDLSWLVM